MRNRQYDFLVFDWDGTLVNSIDWIVHCIQASAANAGHQAPSNFSCRAIIGMGLDEAINTLFPGIKASQAENIIDGYREIFFSRELTVNDVFQGVFNMLEVVQEQGYVLAVATGKCRQGLELGLDQTGLRRFFSFSRCADETLSKPDPTMLNQLIDIAGVTSDRTLMIGDSLHDMNMARKAGVDAFAVTCGADTKNNLLQANPIMCVDHPTDLIDFLIKK